MVDSGPVCWFVFAISWRAVSSSGDSGSDIMRLRLSDSDDCMTLFGLFVCSVFIFGFIGVLSLLQEREAKISDIAERSVTYSAFIENGKLNLVKQ